jgi:DNA recombination protein RmuC
MEFLFLIVGLAVGAVAVWLVARSRVARLETELEHEHRAVATEAALKEEFAATLKGLSADAVRELRKEAKEDLEERQQAVERMIAPIKDSLQKVDGGVRELEKARAEAYGALTTQVRSLAEAQRQLQSETSNLVTALRAPAVRGRWGEMQLRRVVEMAGMVAYCDFVEQASVMSDERRVRPDLVVRLPGGKNVVVDAKAPLQAYLEALEAPDEATRQARLRDHARQIRDHVSKLSAKGYWEQFEPTPEFVVLFLPGETFYSAALEQDPSLIEAGAAQHVIIATPTTLIGLLRAVAYGWRQETVAESARAVSQLGGELYQRLGTLAGHFVTLGKRLDGAVGAYNEAVGSLETRVLVTARRFASHGISASDEIPALEPLERSTRALQSPELVDRPPLAPAGDVADAA